MTKIVQNGMFFVRFYIEVFDIHTAHSHLLVLQLFHGSSSININKNKTFDKFRCKE